MKNATSHTVFNTAYFTALLGLLDEAVIATDENFIIKYWNRRAEYVFGYLMDEALGKESSSVINFVSGKASSQQAKDSLLQKGRWKGEICCKTKAGKTIVLDTSVTAVKNQLGIIEGYVCLHKDITEYDRTKESLATFLSVISSMEEKFLVVDNHLDVVFIDEKLKMNQHYFYKINVYNSKNLNHVLPTTEKAKIIKCFQDALNGISCSYELNKNNTFLKTTWQQLHYFPVKDVSGHITHACCMIRDITAQKEIEQVNEMFYKSRKIFEIFMENSPILAWISDKKNIIRYLNPAYLKTYQLKKECIGKTLSEVFHPEVAAVLMENDKIVIETNQPLQTIEKGFTPDGKEHIYRVVKFPIINDEELFIAGWSIDITEEILLRQNLTESLYKLQQSEAELKTALEKEHQLNDMKSRFVSMASHEFRTPLSTILSSTYLLEKYTTVNNQFNKTEQHINKIKDAIHQLNSLLEDFLSLGKLEEGKTATNLVKFDVVQLIESIIEEVEPFKKKDQSIYYHHTGKHEFESDKKFIKNIVVNLLSNAIKFSGMQQPIYINTQFKNDSFNLTVKDHGIGISQEDQQHLFQSFFRGSNAQNIEGTGLGLHIVKRYAELLNGRIDVLSQQGFGTTIKLTFPIINEMQ